ncbi:MAG: GNAT family N-acetyltransferase [Gemmatimonadales bacterium]|nr:GNAT family N-acetyltransferase [Gemmatimonadales bacterium]
MWRPDRTAQGPQRATVADIEALNRLFSDAFTERYRRDGLSGVRVPFLNPAIWQYAIEDASEGALVWRDARGDLVAFTMVHRSGSEGWMGPLAVRPDRQGEGIGRQVVLAGVEWLQREGVRAIGLETMPRTIENIGFYAGLGFLPGPMTITLQRREPRPRGPLTARLGEVESARREGVLAECRALSDAVADGVDFTRELELTLQLRLGDATLLRHADGTLRAFALWHTAALALGRHAEELRVLKLVAVDLPAAMELLAAVEREAAALRLGVIAVRCQGSQRALFAALVAEGYRVHWTDLRLTFAGHDESVPRGILLSNWEI